MTDNLPLKPRIGRPPYSEKYKLLPGETFEQMFFRLLKEEKDKSAPKRSVGRPRKPDKFSIRYGYIPGRCNAYCKPYGSGKLCKRYPMKDAKRCCRHGGRGNNGGWRTGHRHKVSQSNTLGKQNEV